MASSTDPRKDPSPTYPPWQTPTGLQGTLRDWLATPQSLSAMLVRLILMLSAFVFLDRLVMHGTRISPEALGEAVILWGVVQAAFNSAVSISLIAVLGLLVVWLRLWKLRWQDWDYGQYMRLFIVLVSFVTAWRSSTYDYNLILDQAHYVDRLLLLALVGLVYWRPFFILPFIVLDSAISWQFWYPIGGYSWAQEYMPLKILVLSFVALIVRGLIGRRQIDEWLFLLCCLVAAFYWAPGLGKLELAWPMFEQIGNLLPATYANGWLGFLSASEISTIAQLMSTLNPVLVAFAISFQVSALFVFWHRRALLLFLSIATVFHIGVFASSGILFWQWILIDVGLLLLLKQLWHRDKPPLFDRRHFVLGVMVVGLAPWWADPVKLAWYDSPLAYTYRFEAVGSSGQRYSLPPHFFAPYDYQVTLGGFSYLVDRSLPSVGWGATRNTKLLSAVEGKTTLEQIEVLEKTLGSNHFDGERAARFDDFVQRFVSLHNERKHRRTALTAVQAPRQLFTFERSDAYAGEEPIVGVEVFQVTSLFNASGYHELRRSQVRTIKILPVARWPQT